MTKLLTLGILFSTAVKAVSSIVNEVIKGNLKPLYLFFLREDFTRTKSKKYIQANKNKKDRIIMRIKTFKRKKVACFMFRKKGFKLPLITSFAILLYATNLIYYTTLTYSFCTTNAFMLFMCVKYFRKKIKSLKMS